MASSERVVAVIGAGPVGLFTALLLAKGGIKVTLYESMEGIDQSPRAVGYSPPTMEEFAKAGIVQDVIEAGDVVSDGCAWRNSKGDVLASINPPPDDKSFAAVLSLPELGAILLKRLLETGNAEVRFNESLVRLEQNDDTLLIGLLVKPVLKNWHINVLNGGFDKNVLATYAETRRRVFLEETNPIILANLRRLNSDDPEIAKQREEEFAHINNPKDFVNTIRIGPPDFALTSTSDRIFDTQSEVTWFISVSKIPEWIDEKFVREYKTVNADMTRPKSDQVTPIKRYIQLSNSRSTIEGTERPSWNYVTCLTWPSLFIVHAGVSNPGYKATAGAHIFRRLDQEGSLAQQVVKYSKETPSEKSDAGATRCLIFHKRSSASDEYPEKWFTDRVTRWRDVEASDDRLYTYILYQDVTPKDTEYFFHNTQFSKGSWNKYKAVEAFYFKNETASTAFLQQHEKGIIESAFGKAQAVVGVPDIIV
ncbi:hypothetical protein EAF00_004890 [Botryotinia globosa]|nr:hypothetical protein EAF00_004890 [Botryotinia globosa]